MKKLDNKFKARHRVKFMRALQKVERHLLSHLLDRNIVQSILKPAREILEDNKFWINQEESLVVFMAENFFEYYQLPVPTQFAIYIDTEFKVAPLASMMENTPLTNNIERVRPIKRSMVLQKIA